MIIRKAIVLVLFALLAITCFAEGEENMKISAIEFRNLKEIPQETLSDLLTLKKDGLFNVKAMNEDYKTLKSVEYVEDAKIFPETKNGQLILVIDIQEKADAKERLKKNGIVPLSERGNVDGGYIVKSIEIFGTKSSNPAELKKKIPIQIGSYFSKEKVLEGRDELMKLGLFREVTPDALKYANGIYIKYNVIENPILKGISIEGNTLISSEELISAMTTKIGQVYNSDVLREDADKIMKKYYDKGYVLAGIEDMRIDDNMNLKIKLSEGVLKGIEFKGISTEKASKLEGVKDITKVEEVKDIQLKTEEYILKREMTLEIGKPFELAKFQQSVKNIFRLGYFKSINQDFKKSPDGDGVILVLIIDENKSGSVQGAVSYGSEEGIVGSFSVTDHNFRGRAQSLGITMEASTKHKKRYELSYSDPWVKGTKRLSFSTSIYRKEMEDSTSATDEDDNRTRYIVKTGVGGSIGKGLNDKVRIRLGTRIEKIKESLGFEDPDDENFGEIEINERKVESYMNLVLNPSIYYDTRDNYLNATNGLYAKFGVEFGRIFNKEIYNEEESTVIGKDFYKIAELELRAFHKMLFKNNSMAYRAMFGVADKSTPEGLWFYVGGGDTVRGVSDEKGRYQFVANIENRLKVEDNIQFVLFFDAGNAWKTDVDMRNGKLKMAYGIGLRADTPLGPLRFDYGWPINDDERTKGKFYFNIGQMF